MKELIGKRCKIHVVFNGGDLHYTADIVGVSQTHLHFKDKFGDDYVYRLVDVAQVTIQRGDVR